MARRHLALVVLVYRVYKKTANTFPRVIKTSSQSVIELISITLCAYFDSTRRGNVFSNPRRVINCTAIEILMYDLVHTTYGICSFWIHPVHCRTYTTCHAFRNLAETHCKTSVVRRQSSPLPNVLIKTVFTREDNLNVEITIVLHRSRFLLFRNVNKRFVYNLKFYIFKI